MIISGPNAGGKTVVLKTVGMLLCMMKAGLLLPADGESRLYNFRRLYLNLGDAQNLSADLSTFSGHLSELKPLFADASTVDLVCLDEIAVGTEPQTGAAIAQAILEFLANKKILSLVTTHFEGLKTLALHNRLFRNAAMEYGVNTMHPTYRLAMDIPGQSYGLEVARQVGLPAAVIARAQEIRGSKIGELEQAFADLLGERQKLAESRQLVEMEVSKAETARVHWQKEREALQEARAQMAKKLNAKYLQELEQHRQEYDALIASLRKSEEQLAKKAAAAARLDGDEASSYQEASAGLKSTLQGMKQSIGQLGQQFSVKEEHPGKAVSFDQLQVGDTVFVIPLGKTAVVKRAAKTAQEKIEVASGMVKFYLLAENLRKLNGEAARKHQAQEKRSPERRTAKEKLQHQAQDQPVTPYQTLPVNTLDLRGQEVAGALIQLWKFIDAAVMRGENTVTIIHGHGYGSLKQAVREALTGDKNFAMEIRPGNEDEGGDGVTVVTIS
jgi:DNA mismatch repair protein MutS2